MQYTITITGETDQPTEIQAAADAAVAALRASSTAEAQVDIETPPATPTPVDPTREPIEIRADITFPPSPVVVSARDGEITAVAADIATATAALIAKSVDLAAAAELDPTPVEPAPAAEAEVGAL